jgi:hypothetical protein
MGAFSRLSSSGVRKPFADGPNGNLELTGDEAGKADVAPQPEAGIGARVQEVLDSATHAARQIRAEAEAEGSRYLAERRAEADQERDTVLRELGELREAVRARAQEVERQTGDLLNTLTAAIDSLSGRDPTSGLVLSALHPSGPSLEPVAYPGSASRGRLAERARARATELLDAGTSREDIERILRTSFGVKDPAGVVDTLLRSRGTTPTP